MNILITVTYFISSSVPPEDPSVTVQKDEHEST